MAIRIKKIRLLLLIVVVMLFCFAEKVMAETISKEVTEDIYVTFYPEQIPVYDNYETGIVPMAVDDYTNGQITTYKRLDMFNPKAIQGYTVLNTGMKYFSEDNNSPDANQLGLKRVVYCMEYAKSSPNEGINFSYTYTNTNVYRPEVYIMANGVRYLNQECVNEKFRTGYGSDYDYYVTQMAIHLARGEFTYEYFQERMKSLNSGISENVKNKVLECIYNLYAHGVNITTDPCMLYIYGSDNQNNILMNNKGSTHYLDHVKNTWTQDANGNWITPTANPVSLDYYGGDLRPYYKDMTVTADTSGVNVYQYSLQGGTVSQGFYLYCSKETYEKLQLTGATITVTCELTLPNTFAARVLDYSSNNVYQDVEYYGALAEWGTNKVMMKAEYTIPKTSEQILKLNLKKTQADTDVPIKQVEFLHTRPNGETETIITDEDGEANILGLEKGLHMLKEISAPEGYLLNTHIIKFSVLDDNSIHIESENIESDTNGNITISITETHNVEVEVENCVVPYSVQIYKLNNKGMVLPGAEFTLYADEECQVVLDTKKTDENGTFTLENLTIGKTYYIRETKAPIGYKLSENLETIKIYAQTCPVENIYQYYINDEVHSPDNNDTTKSIYITGDINDRIVHIKVENTTGTILPETGSKNMFIIILIGIVLTLYSLVSQKYIERNRYNYEK